MWMPYSYYFIHTTCSNNIGFGTIFKTIYTFRYGNISHLTAKVVQKNMQPFQYKKMCKGRQLPQWCKICIP